MKCPVCGSDNITTVDSRSDHDSIVRRKKCLVCNHRWSTIEIDKDQWYSALQIKEERRRGRSKMINLDRFEGINEPEDGVYFMTNEQMAEAKEADRLAEIKDLQSEIDDREAELKDLRAQLAELMTG